MEHHETNVSTLKTATQEKIWIPRSDENPRWPESDQSQPQIRSQSTRRRLTLKKSDRLLKRFEFRRVVKEGNRLVGPFICIDFFKGRGKPRLGISVSTRYGSSPERNRFKRLVREAFRLVRSEIPWGSEINVLPRKLAKEASLRDIQRDFTSLIPRKP